MSKRRRTPSYRLHKARQCGVVTVDGTDHYLGRLAVSPGSSASKPQ